MSWKAIHLGPYSLGQDGLTVETLWKHRKTKAIVRGGDTAPQRGPCWHKVPLTIAAATEAGGLLQDFERKTPFWIGDWWNDARARWPEEYHQLVDSTGFELTTLDEYARVAKNIPTAQRMITAGVNFTVHQAVAGLDEINRRRVMVKAHTEGLTVAAVRSEVKRVRRAPVSEGKGRLRGKYRVLYVDPDYSTTTLDQLAKLAVPAHMTSDAALFLWCTESLRFDILQVIAAWEFEHRSAFMWDRVMHQAAGRYLDERHEHLLWCVRGTCPPDQLTPMLDSVVTIRRGPENGEKPEEFRTFIERLYDHGPYLELLAKRHMAREGWTFFGQQIGDAVA